MAATFPDELNALRELVSTLQGTLDAVRTENQLLRQKLEFFIQRYFGGNFTPGSITWTLTKDQGASTLTPASASLPSSCWPK